MPKLLRRERSFGTYKLVVTDQWCQVRASRPMGSSYRHAHGRKLANAHHPAKSRRWYRQTFVYPDRRGHRRLYEINMQRIAFLIRVRPEKLNEYRKLHDPIWPELAAELKASGIRNYTLWLRPDGTEFGYLECDDWQASCDYLAQSEVHTRWQTLMQNYLLSPTDGALGGQPVEMLERSFLLS